MGKDREVAAKAVEVRKKLKPVDRDRRPVVKLAGEKPTTKEARKATLLAKGYSEKVSSHLSGEGEKNVTRKELAERRIAVQRVLPKALVWLVALLAMSPAVSEAARTVIMYECRTQTVTPGGRCWVWFPKGTGVADLPTVADGELPSGWTANYPAMYGSDQSWNAQWAWEIHVPANATPGAFEIDFPSMSTEDPIDITVVAAPTPRTVMYADTNDQEQLQTWLDADYDLELAPRVYTIDEPLIVPDGAKIFSNGGAKLVRTADGSSYAEKMFEPEGAMVLHGLTLTTDDTIVAGQNLFIHDYPRSSDNETPNVTISECIIKRGQLGVSADANVLVERCIFDGSSTGLVGANGVYLNNKFNGPCVWGQHPFFSGGCSGILLATNRFDGTSRGIVCQTGDTVGLMALDTKFTHIRGGQANGGECVLFEAGTNTEIVPDSTHGCRDNTFVDVFITDCQGPGLMLYGSGMHDNQFWNFDSHVDRTSISINAFDDWVITDNEFHNFQCWGNLEMTGDVGVETFSNVQFLETIKGRSGNSGPYSTTYPLVGESWPVSINAAAMASGYSLAFSGCNVVRKNGSLETMTNIFAHPFTIETTSATPYLMGQIPIRDNTSAIVTVTVAANEVVSGDTANTALYVRTAHCNRKNGGGAAIANGVVETLTKEDGETTYDCTLSTSAEYITVTVTGKSGDTIKWRIVDVDVQWLAL